MKRITSLLLMIQLLACLGIFTQGLRAQTEQFWFNETETLTAFPDEQGFSELKIDVKASSDNPVPGTVGIRVAGGTAIEGVDFYMEGDIRDFTGKSVTWVRSRNVGISSFQSVSVITMPNPARTAPRTVILELHDPQPVDTFEIIEPSQLTIVISDAGMVDFDWFKYDIDENGDAVIGVERKGALQGAVSVDFATADGSLTASEYQAASGTLNWADGEGGVKTFTVSLQNGVMAGLTGPEHFKVQLSNWTGGAGEDFYGVRGEAIVSFHPTVVSTLYQEWETDPSTARLPDFSFAGYGYGEMLPPDVPETAMPVFHVADYGAFPDDGLDDRLQIQKAIDAAEAAGGGIVKLEAGTYLMNTLNFDLREVDEFAHINHDDSYPLFIRGDNIILRGAGSDPYTGTRLYSPYHWDREYGAFAEPSMIHVAAPELKGGELRYGHREQGFIPHDWYGILDGSATHYDRRSIYAPQSEHKGVILANGTSDMLFNNSVLQVDDASQLREGELYFVYVLDAEEVEDMNYPYSIEGWDYLQNGIQVENRYFRPVDLPAMITNQIMTVESISGNTVTFRERAKWDFEGTHRSVIIVPYVYIRNVGVEDLNIELEYMHRMFMRDAGGKSVQFVNVAHSWAKNLRITNMSAVSFSRTKNCTAVNIVTDGLPRHEGSKALSSATDNLLEDHVVEAYGSDHDFSLQEEAVGNVYLNPRSSRSGVEIDVHAGYPYANLYDNLDGISFASSQGGNPRLRPNSGPLMTFWNWTLFDPADKMFTNDDGEKRMVHWDPAEFVNNFVAPIFVGMRMADQPVRVDNLDPADELYKDNRDDPTGAYLAEAINARVSPESLYLAQLYHRTGRNYRAPGVYPIINGDAVVTLGETVAFDGSQTVGTYANPRWLMDGVQVAAGNTVNITFDTLGEKELILEVESDQGTVMWARRNITVINPAQPIPPINQDPKPASAYATYDGGALWQFEPVGDDSWIYMSVTNDNFWGPYVPRQPNDTYIGGLVYTDLDPDGHDLSAGTYDFYFTKSRGDSGGSFVVRFIARDINGYWAALDLPIAEDIAYTGDMASRNWVTPPSQLNLNYNAAFDPTQITAVGYCVVWSGFNVFRVAGDIMVNCRYMEIRNPAEAVATEPYVVISDPEPYERDVLTGDTWRIAGYVQDDDAISSVDIYFGDTFYASTDLVGGRFSYTFPNNLALNTYDVKVIATDSDFNSSSSDPIPVDVLPNLPPTISWVEPVDGSDLRVDTTHTLSVAAADPENDLSGVQFYVDGNLIGSALNSGGSYIFNWTPRFYGPFELTAVATDGQGQTTESDPLSITVVPNDDPTRGSTVAYLGGSGKQTTQDVMQLSDDTIIVAGGAEDLNWLPVGITPSNLTHANLTNVSSGRTPFILHMSSDLSTILDVVAFPAGSALNIRRFAVTSIPGAKTGDLYISGTIDEDEYFIARLNNNFVGGVPSGIAWVIRARTSNTTVGNQPWDVGGDGRVVYADTATLGGVEAQYIRFVDATGQPMKLNNLRATHIDSSENDLTQGLLTPAQDPASRGLPVTFAGLDAHGGDSTQVAYSAIRIPRDISSTLNLETDGNGDTIFLDQAAFDADLTIPAATQPSILYAEDANNNGTPDYLEVSADGNGEQKKGMWPHDLFHKTILLRHNDGGTNDYGYYGYRSAGGKEIGAITVDRETNDFYFGMSLQSQFYDPYTGDGRDQPDFEPFVIAYDSTGNQKWWSRLYHEWIDQNENGVMDYGTFDAQGRNEYFIGTTSEPRISPPDQYVDGLVIDYSGASNILVVNARCHGGNYENLWEGNTIAANPGGEGFQNAFTGGSSGDNHISWLGRFEVDTGTILNSTYFGGFWTFQATVGLTQHTDAILDGWRDHNTGYPDISSVFVENSSIRVDESGNIYVVGRSTSRIITTLNAYQKNPKHFSTPADLHQIVPGSYEGGASWNQFVRVYEPDLDGLIYSTVLGGYWDYPVDAEGRDILYDPDTPIRAQNSDNTEIQGIFPTDSGVLVAGYHMDDDLDNVADGNPVPTNLIPSWGLSTPNNETALLARLSYFATANIPPTVAIVEPSAPTTYGRAQAITLGVSAVDPDPTGGMDRVEIYINNSFYATITEADGDGIFRTTWTSPNNPDLDGEYDIVAVGVDVDNGNTSTSALTLTIDGNEEPTMSITGVFEGQEFNLDTPYNFDIAASDDESIAQIRFWVDDVLEDSDTVAPYSFEWIPLAESTPVLRFRATDNRGKFVEQTFNVSAVPGNIPPTVVITSPADAATVSMSQPVNFAVSATETNGILGRVLCRWRLPGPE